MHFHCRACASASNSFPLWFSINLNKCLHRHVNFLFCLPLIFDSSYIRKDEYKIQHLLHWEKTVPCWLIAQFLNVWYSVIACTGRLWSVVLLKRGEGLAHTHHLHCKHLDNRYQRKRGETLTHWLQAEPGVCYTLPKLFALLNSAAVGISPQSSRQATSMCICVWQP